MSSEHPGLSRDDTGVGTSPEGYSHPSARRPGRAEDDLRPFQRLKSYQILKRLGGGGMADVYVARATLADGVDRRVALKTMLPDYGSATPLGSLFLQEARVSATLDHPNLVTVFDYGELSGRPYLAMDYVHGRDLRRVIRAQRDLKQRPPPGFALAVGIEACRALEYVHEKADLDGRPLSLVHRDVSPGNLLLTPRGEVKLVDFGVAATEDSRGADGMMVGKLRYVTREQAVGEEPQPDWDLFSLGIVLYELITLSVPYRVPSAQALFDNDIRDRRRPPSELNPLATAKLDDLLLVATDRDPRGRFRSARELRLALEEVAEETAPAPVGPHLASLFGEVLAEEEVALQQLMGEARRQDHASLALRVQRRWRAAMRRVTSSALFRRHPRLARSLGAAVVLLLLAVGLGGVLMLRSAAGLNERLEAIDARMISGRLTAANGGGALDLLLDAQQEWPGASAISERLTLLSSRFESLADAAVVRHNYAEAAVHYQAALLATPKRDDLAARLATVEKRVREGAMPGWARSEADASER